MEKEKLAKKRNKKIGKRSKKFKRIGMFKFLKVEKDGFRSWNYEECGNDIKFEVWKYSSMFNTSMVIKNVKKASLDRSGNLIIETYVNIFNFGPDSYFRFDIYSKGVR